MGIIGSGFFCRKQNFEIRLGRQSVCENPKMAPQVPCDPFPDTPAHPAGRYFFGIFSKSSFESFCDSAFWSGVISFSSESKFFLAAGESCAAARLYQA